ncbi:MAG: penicillin-binding protein 1C [Parvularculaceae bacterium]
MFVELGHRLISDNRNANKRFLRLAAMLASGFIAIFVMDLAFPPPISRGENVSVIVTDREGYWLHAFTTKQGRWRFSVNLDDVDPQFVRDVVAIEDKRFWSHWGVDLKAVLRASLSAVRSGRIVSGASTITMQTARLLEPRQRNIFSKFIEMLRAFQLERRLSKREILELYLTLAPYGGNLEGIRAASLIYFGKEPNHLAPSERALLIALPQAPEARRPDRRKAAAEASRQVILRELAQSGLIEQNIVVEAGEASLVSKRKPFPRFAYHASLEIAALHSTDRSEIRSSIDISKQITTERLIAEHAATLSDGATVAAIVVDDRSQKVLASVGSSSLEVEGGWIDLTDRIRSPGSLLKPFIYALAFEDGVAGPDTVIDDMPRGFGGYRPENFDRTFRGEVKVRDALQHSLNVPAVAMLDRIGAVRFASLLNDAGTKLMRRKRASDDGPSLAIALGGAGVTMRDVARLYSGLANDGEVKPLVWLAAESAEKPGMHMFTSDTAARINAILRGAPALAGRAPALLANAAPIIAYKTGTSYGYRDQWAAGSADGLTIVVWVGRADGAPRPGQTGRKAAAPLLFSLFDALTDGQASKPIDPPDSRMSESVHLRLPQKTLPPTILYPVPGSEIYVSSFGGDGVPLAADGGDGEYHWYVDGAEIVQAPNTGRAMWRPTTPGFYDLAVVDSRGRSTRAKVRVADVN